LLACHAWCVCHYQIFVTVFVYTDEFSPVSCFAPSSVGTSSIHVEGLLHFLESAGGVAELDLVEGLGGVEPVTVAGSHLVGVSVLLGGPSGTIPVLSVHGVTTGQGVKLGLNEMGVLAESRLSLHTSVVDRLSVLEPYRVVSLAESRLGEDAGLGVGVPGSGDMVVRRVDVGASQVLSLGPVSATSGFTGVIGLGNEGVVESSGRKSVLGCVNDLLVEHRSGLFGNGMSEMAVGTNVGSVASVPRDGHGFVRDRFLIRHVVSGGSVEVVVSPVEEFLLSVLVVSTVVADSELSSCLK